MVELESFSVEDLKAGVVLDVEIPGRAGKIRFNSAAFWLSRLCNLG